MLVKKLYKHEHLQKTIQNLFKELGLTGNPQLPRAKSTLHTDKRHYRNMLSPGQAKTTEHIFAQEIEWGQYQFWIINRDSLRQIRQNLSCILQTIKSIREFSWFTTQHLLRGLNAQITHDLPPRRQDSWSKSMTPGPMFQCSINQQQTSWSLRSTCVRRQNW